MDELEHGLDISFELLVKTRMTFVSPGHRNHARSLNFAFGSGFTVAQFHPVAPWQAAVHQTAMRFFQQPQKSLSRFGAVPVARNLLDGIFERGVQSGIQVILRRRLQ